MADESMLDRFKAKLIETIKSMTDLNQMAKLMSEKEIMEALMGPTEQPALPERTAEHAAHDTSIDAEGEETEGGAEDGEDIPF